MYEIRPESVKSFITDKNIKLPRFQRKQTWDDKKNFELCISLFKEYPLGVTIVSVDKKDGINIRWLLDGRQRRNALLKLYEDPENIYKWAKKYIKFKNSSQPDEIKELFWKMINEYIEYDEDESDNVTSNEDDTDTTDANEEYEENLTVSSKSSGLDFLLDIILMIHNKKKSTNGFTKPFDLSGYVERLRYTDIENGVQVLSSQKLKSFIDQYRNGAEKYTPDSFYSYIDDTMTITNTDKLKKYIKNNWQSILYRINVIDRLDSILTNSKIGIIEVKEILFADCQKIFNIINTKGEKLTAVEVLSAKPSWNVPVNFNDAPIKMQESVAEFYKTMGINIEQSIVKWDLPATFLERVGKNFVIQDFDTSNPNELSKALTYGFKLISGIWENGIKKDDIDKLSKDRNIDWLSKYESLVEELHRMFNVIESLPYFKFFKTWRATIMELTNDSIALNFFILAYKDWDRKGKPNGSDSNTRTFVRNCFILWDKLIYEYLTLKWKGSSDSKVGRNILELANTDYAYKPVPAEYWIRLLEEIHDKYTVFGENVSIKNMKPILYHFYSMKSIAGPESEYEIEVDHIIPQDAFKTAFVNPNPNAQHCLYNLGLLPKGENISKSNKKLNEISNEWLRSQIEKYEFIGVDDWDFYSNIVNYGNLFDAHYELFKEAFLETGCRGNIIFN